MPAEQPPLADYAFISDCHSTALISGDGAIDWCCMPRLDSPPCFGRLLDWQRGGFCRLGLAGEVKRTRRYLPATLILESRLVSAEAEVRLFDFFPMRKGGRHAPHQQILRLAEGVRGEAELVLDFQPRFDYGSILPWLKRVDDHILAMGGATGLLLSGDFDWQLEGRHALGGRCRIGAGERRHLSILFGAPGDLDAGLVAVPDNAEIDQRLEETRRWWERWTEQTCYQGRDRELVLRSAIVLKGLTHAPSGAIAAAPTSSLPETPGGSRNWDYRYSWVRDSAFTVRSLVELGFTREADGFRRFLERSCAGSAEELQILFGVGGERRLHEYELDQLSGYQGARPVRVGNAAEHQLQLDVYGELLDLAWGWHQRGASPDDDYWEFLVELIDAVVANWRQPDRGIWEMRGEPRHFVLSKAMCWVALDRALKLAEDLGREAPVARWRRTRDEVRQAVLERGYDARRQCFVQAFDHSELDASLLLLPLFGFIEARDPRMVRTVAAIRGELEEDGLLRRYLTNGADGLDGEEGVFLACSFWLVECLALQGELAAAREVFKRAAAAGNDLGLFAEEYLPGQQAMLGNYPQGLTHLSLIAAAVRLDAAAAAAGGQEDPAA